MEKTLLKIAEKFNRKDISWAIGASYLLKLYNIVDKANDLDILVLKDDLKQAASILDKIGTKQAIEVKKEYSSKKFYKYHINGVEVDLFAGLVINYNNSFYDYHFEQKSITDYKKINNVLIPLASLEDWYILYSLMPRKENKVKLLEEHFNKQNIKNPEIFNEILKKDLPNELKNSINTLLK